MAEKITFNQLIGFLRSSIQNFPDKRTGQNLTYSMENIGLGAFSVFFTQSPSFLYHQEWLKKNGGISNAETIFGMEKIPTDNHIRDILDEVSPELVFPVFEKAHKALERTNYLDSFCGINQNILIALDGTWCFSSDKIYCEKCSTIEHKDGKTTYYHSAITPVIVAPEQKKAISLPPEFITPQDGHKKQDCEINAAKRWVDKNKEKYSSIKCTLLGDDLYSRQPFCKDVLDANFHFIFVCKPESHKYLYELLEEGKDIHTLTFRRWNGRFWETFTYRYAKEVPLRDTEDALMVNWCELTISNEEGKVLYKNSFITDHKIHEKNVVSIVSSGRARWKIENENNNTLKTKGYHLDHNFGHGKKHLSSLLVSLNILAFLFHTILEFVDEKYRLLRKTLPRRKTFFDDIRALTRYVCFESWDHMLDFMLKGLKDKWVLDTL